MTQVVASLVERSISGVASSSKAGFEAGADIVEVRLDKLESTSEDTIRKIRSVVRGPAIATLRSRQEGGSSGLEKADRVHKLQQVIGCDFEYIDLELSRDMKVLKQLESEEIKPITIVSHHFEKPVKRSVVESALKATCSVGDVGKVAMVCEDASQAIMLARLGLEFSKTSRKFVLIGMGTQGQLTRTCADTIGCEFAYSCLPDKEAAPGQLDVATQRALLTHKKTLLGLLGHPVSHSVSKPMQEAALREAGIVGAYVPLDFPPRRLNKKELLWLKRLGFVGLNVTIPHKWWAFDNCTVLDRAARATGAVNTITFGKKHIVGENTDVTGFSKLIEGKMNISEKTRALVVGAGGAALAVAHVLNEKKAGITVIDIERRRASRLAKKFGGRSATWLSIWRGRRQFDLIVNCTPVGMKGVSNDNPVREYLFRPGTVFVDIIYNPPETMAMKVAKRMGAEAYGGLEMLVQQGAQSYRLWIGRSPSTDAMREAARGALK